MYQGRQEAINRASLIDSKFINKREAILIKNGNIFCQRCGVMTEKEQSTLVSEQLYYCPACIQYGRITTNDWLVWEGDSSIYPAPTSKEVLFSWSGALTAHQQVISDRLIENESKKKDSLVWAVTGAGKTEMIFPLIEKVLAQNGRIAICSPRIDVCRELYPRVAEVFPKEEVLLLHGGSEEKYRYTKLMICTMHQLFYFYRTFDLIIIDEVDAFPYEGDKQLSYVCSQAIKDEGTYVYLTATPSSFLIGNLREGTIHLTLPKRFHGRELPVPKVIWQNKWRKTNNYFFKTKLRKLIDDLLTQTFVLIFCPSIPYMKLLLAELINYYPEDEVVSIHAEDSQRKEKVADVRKRQYKIVLTTTILERGVTFERVSVIVLGANHPVYTKSTLVQISGRVDRKGNEKNGAVFFICNRWTHAIQKSITEIKSMNTKAKAGDIH